jgi:hypothetical protein
VEYASNHKRIRFVINFDYFQLNWKCASDYSDDQLLFFCPSLA